MKPNTYDKVCAIVSAVCAVLIAVSWVVNPATMTMPW